MVEQLALGVRGRLAINLKHDVRRVEIGAWSQQPSQCPSACGSFRSRMDDPRKITHGCSASEPAVPC